jgi:hypothetical protein
MEHDPEKARPGQDPASAESFGARVIMTAGSAEKCDARRKLGADLAIDDKTEDFVAVIKEAPPARAPTSSRAGRRSACAVPARH